MDTLPDLRVTIAEGMEALAARTWRTAPHLREPGQTSEQALMNYNGAQTLRWCAEYEATPTDGEREELERLREFADAVGDVLSGREHPGSKITAIRKALGEVA